jgi:hypothetical protein
MRIILVFAFLFLSSLGFAALPSPGFATPPPPPPTTPPPPGLPIDGGIFVMVVVGLIFGIYKIYQHKKRVIS